MRAIDPKRWGPSGWALLHGFAFQLKQNAKPEATVAMMMILEALPYLLPCPKCQRNYKNHVAAIGYPSSTKEIFRWVHELHDRVNVQKVQGSSESKPVSKVSLSEAKQMYGQPVRWNDIALFLDAVIEGHPGANAVNSQYVDHLLAFLKGVFVLMNTVTEIPSASQLKSRMQTRTWWRKRRSLLPIQVTPIEYAKCTNVCM